MYVYICVWKYFEDVLFFNKQYLFIITEHSFNLR